MALRIREAEPSDNERLIGLARECPMRGIVTLYVDRAPDFFFLNRLQGDEWRVYVAEENGELIGSLSVAYRQAFVEGRPCRIAYLSDVKILPKYRGSTVAYRLLAAMFDAERSNDFDYFVCSALEGNTTVTTLFQGRTGFPSLHPVGVVHVVNNIPTRLPGRNNRTKVRRAADGDVEKIVVLLNKFHRSQQFAPVFSPDSFLSMIRTSTGLSLNDYFLVEEGDSISAVASCWDQAASKRLVIERHSATTQALVLASRIGSAFGIIPRLPGPHQPLRVLQVRHVAFAERNKEAARGPISFLLDRGEREGYHIVQIALSHEDVGLLPHSLRVSVSLQVFCGSLRHDVKKLNGQRVYEDVCLV